LSFTVVGPVESDEFTVHLRGDIVHRGKLEPQVPDLHAGRFGYWDSPKSPGTYSIRVGDLRSHGIPIYENYHEHALRVLLTYYRWQRCGDSMTGWHTPCHTDDAVKESTGEPIDLAGGWHQSCDLRKWTMGNAVGVVGLAAAGLRIRPFEPQWASPAIAEELRWGNAYLHKMVREDGGLRESLVLPHGWSARELREGDSPDFAAYLTIAAQALCSQYFAQTDPGYARACTTLANRMWRYLEQKHQSQDGQGPLQVPPNHE